MLSEEGIYANYCYIGKIKIILVPAVLFLDVL